MVGADRQMKGVACAKIELGLVRKPRGRAKVFPLHRKGPRRLSAHRRVNAESAAARWSAPRAPVRNFIDSAEANSVVVQSLIVSSDLFLSGEPNLREGSLRFTSLKR